MRTLTMLQARQIVLAMALWGVPASSFAQAETPDWLRTPYLNVVLSVQHVDAMRAFYGEALALESLRDIDLPARVGRPFDTIMIRFRVGRSEIKMIPHEHISRPPGGRTNAAGLRWLSVPVTDGALTAQRIQSATGTKVEWIQDTDYQVAWIRDPDDNEIEIRWYDSDAASAERSQLHLGITTNDLEASRRHYGTWLGLTQGEPTARKGFPGKTAEFIVGESLLRLWSPGKKLATDSGWTKDGYGLRYVQFIVKDSYALHDDLKSKGATIAQEPTPLGSSTVLLFAADPDGVINECIGPAKAAE
jgi:catechol 2,3-dioxygenase-like lactoylglutathione lyase family enzyme